MGIAGRKGFAVAMILTAILVIFINLFIRFLWQIPYLFITFALSLVLLVIAFQINNLNILKISVSLMMPSIAFVIVFPVVILIYAQKEGALLLLFLILFLFYFMSLPLIIFGVALPSIQVLFANVGEFKEPYETLRRSAILILLLFQILDISLLLLGSFEVIPFYKITSEDLIWIMIITLMMILINAIYDFLTGSLSLKMIILTNFFVILFWLIFYGYYYIGMIEEGVWNLLIYTYIVIPQMILILASITPKYSVIPKIEFGRKAFKTFWKELSTG